MRVVTATGFHPFEKMGCAEHQTLLLARGLAELGHEVIFLATKSDQKDKFSIGKITILNTPGQHNVGWKKYRQLVAKTIQESKPDLCYVRVFEEAATIVPHCKEADLPVIQFEAQANQHLYMEKMLTGH